MKRFSELSIEVQELTDFLEGRFGLDELEEDEVYTKEQILEALDWELELNKSPEYRAEYAAKQNKRALAVAKALFEKFGYDTEPLDKLEKELNEEFEANKPKKYEPTKNAPLYTVESELRYNNKRYGRGKAYVARLVGLDDKWGFKREFAERHTEYDSSSSTTWYKYSWELEDGLYEKHEQNTFKVKRTYFIIKNGVLEEISKEEAKKLLEAREAEELDIEEAKEVRSRILDACCVGENYEQDASEIAFWLDFFGFEEGAPSWVDCASVKDVHIVEDNKGGMFKIFRRALVVKFNDKCYYRKVKPRIP